MTANVNIADLDNFTARFPRGIIALNKFKQKNNGGANHIRTAVHVEVDDPA